MYGRVVNPLFRITLVFISLRKEEKKMRGQKKVLFHCLKLRCCTLLWKAINSAGCDLSGFYTLFHSVGFDFVRRLSGPGRKVMVIISFDTWDRKTRTSSRQIAQMPAGISYGYKPLSVHKRLINFIYCRS